MGILLCNDIVDWRIIGWNISTACLLLQGVFQYTPVKKRNAIYSIIVFYFSKLFLSSNIFQIFSKFKHFSNFKQKN